MPSAFTFDMKLSNGVQLKSKLENLNDTKLNASGSATTAYYFTDSKNKYLANFEPLIMTDAAGAMSNDIEMDITPTSCLLVTCYSVTLTANDKWLNDPLRVYPVDIDPTIVHEQNPDFSSGVENRSVTNSSSAVETKFKELSADINTVGLWHFNEGTSTTAYDASGNSNNGTLTNGPVWNGPTDSQVGLGKSSMKFDGVNDYVTVADNATLDPGTAITVEAWINIDAFSGTPSVVGKRTSGNVGGYLLSPNASGTLFFYIYDAAWYNASGGTLTANRWYHIAGTYDGNTISAYIDGVQVGSTARTGDIDNTTATLQIGHSENTGDTAFNGKIDEVRISNKARTPEEIAADASRYPYAVHESPVIDFGSTPNSLDSLNYTATGVQTGDGETPYSRDGLVAQWNFNETSRQ